MRHCTLALLVIAVLLGTGCRKRTSPEYYDAEGRHSVLVARMGDDAYLDPEMQTVIGLLNRVPANAREADKAASLLSRIKDETARVQREADVRSQAIANAGTQTQGGPSFGSGSTTALRPIEPVPEVGPAADAGPVVERPTPGMNEADFTKKFGACMDPGEAFTVPNEKDTGTVYLVGESAACQKKMGGGSAGRLGYVFAGGKLKGTMVRSQVKSTIIVDAGTRPVVVGYEDAGTYLVLPGQPLPPGYIIPDAGP